LTKHLLGLGLEQSGVNHHRRPGAQIADQQIAHGEALGDLPGRD
jgi:hypothetical protein